MEQFVPRFHVFAVQERPEPEPPEVIVKQPGYIPFRVDSSVVDEHITRWPLMKICFDVSLVAKDLIANVTGCGRSLHVVMTRMLY